MAVGDFQYNDTLGMKYDSAASSEMNLVQLTLTSVFVVKCTFECRYSAVHLHCKVA